jgi:hypothetical protein
VLITDSLEKLKEMIKIVEEFNTCNGMAVNPPKCVIISNDPECENIKISIKDHNQHSKEIRVLQHNEAHKILGVKIAADLRLPTE